MKANVYLSQETRMYAVVIGGFVFGGFEYFGDSHIGSIVLTILAGEYDFIKEKAGDTYEEDHKEYLYCSYDLTIKL